MNSSGSDIEDLEEEKQVSKAHSRPISNLYEASEFESSAVPVHVEFAGLSIDEPRKVREGRDGYFVYPIIHKGNEVSKHRYKEFVWLRNELSLQFPACASPALPEKEGVVGYWTSQDPLFYSFRRYGLEKFLITVSQHPKLSKSADFISFIKDDEVTFHLRMKKSESNKGWYGKISEWGVSIAGVVSSYISAEQSNPQNDGDFEFANSKNEIKLLYQQQEALCNQGRSLVTSEENEITSNLALSKAYDNMSKVEKESLSEKLKILAETHAQISEAHRSVFNTLKQLVGQEMEDCKRITFGLLEALERREKIKNDKNLVGQFNIKEINNDLKQEIAKFNQEKTYLSEIVSKRLIEYKQELTEGIANVWREASNKINS